MSTGQTMITAAFFVLLIMSFIKANQMLIESAETKYQTEAFELAVGMAQDLLVEASKKKFDEFANQTGTQNVSEFTSSGSLGPTSVERSKISVWPDTTKLSAEHYDDFDDYNGYQRTVNTDVMRGFQLSAEVYYVVVTDPNTNTTSRTYMKRLNVTVQHSQYLSTPVVLSRIMTY